MAHKLFLFNFLILAFFFATCSTVEPPPTGKTLTLTLEDVSCIEAWIKLTTTNIQLPTTVTLKQNNITRTTINLVKPDTLLYIDSLLPNINYNFQVSSIQHQVSSNELSVITMDTTSHNFTWQTFAFGEHSSSVLYDVAIIDENNIWAVGEIYMNDSLGNPDPNAYNAVHWDGSEWKLFKLQFFTFCNQPNTGSYPARSILAFGENDIWITSGSQITHFDGTNQITTECIPVSVNKLWGTDDDNIYAVGQNGGIAHYTNGQWTKIESGTTTIINDIWGIVTEQGNTILYCPVSSFFVPGDKKILKITNGIVDSVLWGRDIRLYSAWAANENILYVCGEGAYENKFDVWNEINLYPVGTNSIRGNGLNDIFIVGDYGAIFHFNGARWQILNIPNNKGYSKVAVKDNIVAMSGNFQGKALIEIGRRN